jgi:hypothetical protein
MKASFRRAVIFRVMPDPVDVIGVVVERPIRVMLEMIIESRLRACSAAIWMGRQRQSGWESGVAASA